MRNGNETELSDSAPRMNELLWALQKVTLGSAVDRPGGVAQNKLADAVPARIQDERRGSLTGR